VACVDFTLPTDVGTLSVRPSFVPLAGHTRSKCYIKKTNDQEIKKGPLDIVKSKKRCLSSTKAKSRTKKVKSMLLDVDLPNEERPPVAVINSHCQRTISFHQLDKSSWGSSKMVFVGNGICEPYFRENCRPRSIGKSQELPTTLVTGRAARANSRRMYKSLAALGDTLSKNAVDRLAGRDREQHLRFDKSQIHGWGVYAETPISMGDMIIEYRGELIGNAVADKREKEYEKLKMDDYMFRIDTCTVCDATMLGNVTRYINASCSPNCYTQIITAGENKRIVIYAKRDIRRGEEICYTNSIWKKINVNVSHVTVVQ
jgi:histone-lysine N-methyltransferase SETD1